jgi:catechol 2,3-dioxygenase-like lactoylglutathione lyase family enzyme
MKHITRRQMLLSLPAVAIAPRFLAPATDGPIRITGINHVTLNVSDVNRSVDFYQGLFGMPRMKGQGTGIDLQIGNGPQFLALSSAGTNPPGFNHICLGVENFNVNRVKGILAQHGVTESDSTEPMHMRVVERGGVSFRDPDGITIELRDPRYCAGSGELGNVCGKVDPSPKKGLLALKGWSHTTNFVSDGARSNKFYQDVFGLKPHAYQGPGAPVMDLGDGIQFFMFAGGGARGGGPPRPASINHICMNMDNFNPDAVIKALESYGIKPRANPQGTPGPLVHYISLRMENRGGAKEGTPELYFTDPDGLLIQLQDTKYCGGGGLLGEICKV